MRTVALLYIQSIAALYPLELLENCSHKNDGGIKTDSLLVLSASILFHTERV